MGAGREPQSGQVVQNKIPSPGHPLELKKDDDVMFSVKMRGQRWGFVVQPNTKFQSAFNFILSVYFALHYATLARGNDHIQFCIHTL